MITIIILSPLDVARRFFLTLSETSNVLTAKLVSTRDFRRK
jgi:hypothetical protein